MAFNWKELLVTPFEQLLEGLGESKLEDVLDNIHAKDPEEHKIACVVLNFGTNKIKPYTDGTATKLDDAGVDMISQAVKASAAKFGIDLDQHTVTVVPIS